MVLLKEFLKGFILKKMSADGEKVLRLPSVRRVNYTYVRILCKMVCQIHVKLSIFARNYEEKNEQINKKERVPDSIPYLLNAKGSLLSIRILSIR